jgi:hypothetical protein
VPSPLPQEPHSLELQRPDANEERLATALTALLFLGIAIALIRPFFSRDSWLIFVQDDFLYYLKVAQNIAHGRGSTFNGIVPTNGYQPLWLLCLVVLSRVTGNPRLILAFLALSDFIAAIAVFLLARRLLRTSGVRSLLVFALAAWTTLYSVTLFFYGMEVTLTVPLMLGVLCLLHNLDWLTRSSLHTFALGLLLSAMVLSRIDTLIFGALLLAGILLTPSLRALITPKLSLGILLGLLPLVFYFVLNRVLFHLWLPVSGIAKELKLTPKPSLEPWRDFSHPVSFAFILIIVTAIALLPSLTRRIGPIQLVLFRAVLLFPFLYYCTLSFLSDWPLWGWYIYPVRAAICISFLIFCLYPPFARTLQRPAILALLLLTVFATVVRMRWTVQQADIYAASLDIQRFASTHPGTYAMGDRAGRVGFLLTDPVVNLEGLMMDRDYLAYVRDQSPLREVLAQYNVRYYIGTAYKPFTGCFEASEPVKAGPHSAHMRAEFCEPPLATYFHHGIQTLIFDLHPNP